MLVLEDRSITKEISDRLTLIFRASKQFKTSNITVAFRKVEVSRCRFLVKTVLRDRVASACRLLERQLKITGSAYWPFISTERGRTLVLPPILEEGNGLVVLDGSHRLHAAFHLRRRSMYALVIEGKNLPRNASKDFAVGEVKVVPSVATWIDRVESLDPTLFRPVVFITEFIHNVVIPEKEDWRYPLSKELDARAHADAVIAKLSNGSA